MQDRGFILNKIEYGDYDVIGTFYTINLGKINLLVKNAKKSKKRFVGKLEPFNLIDIEFKYNNRNSINLLESANLDDANPFCELDAKIIVLSSLINEYIQNFEENENPDKNKFEFLQNFFSRKNRNNYSLCLNETIKFQLKYLKELGIEPIINRCFKCNTSLKEIKFFDLKNGGTLCNGCQKKVDSDTIKFKKSIDLKNIKKNDASKSFLVKIIALFSEFHSGKQFNSVKYLET
tara:strand:- start:1231 stop:1932 length:702 start_codon:yes stop_codon:yes gene_type:complete